MQPRYHIIQVEGAPDELWFILDTWLNWYSPFDCEESVLFAYVALVFYHAELATLAWFQQDGQQMIFPSYAPVKL